MYFKRALQKKDNKPMLGLLQLPESSRHPQATFR